jgi:SAM-dependent methyltransferase
MPRLWKTIIPRVKKSFAKRGVVASIFRSVLLPIQLYREHKVAKELARDNSRSEFDLTYGVNTDGDIGGVTYLSDLEIPSPNWIYGSNYVAIEPERFMAAILNLDIDFEEFLFIDLGSGKGRALLLASRFPFKKIIGIEFSRELHLSSEQNIRKYSSPEQKCKSIESVCMDFTEFSLPPEPLVLYLNLPCDGMPLAKTVENIHRSLREMPRPIYVVFMSPVDKAFKAVLDGAEFLVKIAENNEKTPFTVYKST